MQELMSLYFKYFVLFFFAWQTLAYSSESVLCANKDQLLLSFSKVIESRSSDEFSMITWNAHKLADKDFLPDLIHLSHETDLILIQEAMHQAELQNRFELNLNFSFSFNKSFCNSKNEATGVMNASRYLLQNNLNLVSPVNEPLTSTPKVSGYSKIIVPEIGPIHIINTHGLNFNLGSDFKKQIDHLTNYIMKLSGPIIWAGDFNTWSSDRMSYLNKSAQKLGLTHLKPLKDSRNLKLDHVYARGLQALSTEILDTYNSSDHWPIKVIFKKSY